MSENLANAAVVQEYKVQDVSHVLEFTGRWLAHVTTESSRSARWTIMDLYRIEDEGSPNDQQYVLSVTGRSVLFHDPDGECNAGVPTPVDRLPVDAEACPRCLGRRETVKTVADRLSSVHMEVDWHKAEQCPTVADVVRELRFVRGERGGSMSRPAMRLLQFAALTDELFKPENAVERL